MCDGKIMPTSLNRIAVEPAPKPAYRSAHAVQMQCVVAAYGYVYVYFSGVAKLLEQDHGAWHEFCNLWS